MLPFLLPHAGQRQRGQTREVCGGGGKPLPRDRDSHWVTLTSPFAPPGTMSPAHMCCYSVTHSCGRRCNWLQLQLQLFACLFVCLLAGLPYECEYFAGFLGLLLSAGHPTPSSPGSPAESVGKTSFVLLIMFLITWPGDELFHGSDIQLKVGQKYTNLWLHMETIVFYIDFQKLQSLSK